MNKMVKTIIEAFPKEKREAAEDGSKILHIAECFCDTIQGENFTGNPAVFLRMKSCTLNCTWCDTTEVWRQGNSYSVNEVLALLDETGVIDRLMNGHHLVLTGGSPLLQQESLCELIDKIIEEYGFRPIIEIENEAVLMPTYHMIHLVDCWNNSPKLQNSGVKSQFRYIPEAIKKVASLDNSWFKFVISNEDDWFEIEQDFLMTGLIAPEQIVLMPEGATREQLQKNYQMIVDLAVKYNVRMTDRLHVMIWNKTVGV